MQSQNQTTTTTAKTDTLPPTRNQLRPLKYDYADSFGCTYVVSVVAASIAELATYPLDLTKTRLQIQGEAAVTSSSRIKSQIQYRGMMATAYGIIKEEGTLKLWQGVPPALYRHVVYSGVRICSYDFMRKKMAKNDTGKDVALPLWKSAFCGVTAGAVAQWLASPADLVKVQIQMEGKRRLMGEAPRVNSSMHAFKEIIRCGGIKGLWKGSIPNVQRAALVNLGDLTTYDTIKHMIMEKLNMPDCHTVHVLASICAGFVAAIMGTPADVVKTRIMNQPTDDKGSMKKTNSRQFQKMVQLMEQNPSLATGLGNSAAQNTAVRRLGQHLPWIEMHWGPLYAKAMNGIKGLLYKGSVDCLKQTVAKEGFVALYKGFLPCWIRMAPWSLTFWLSFEQIRAMIGASSY